MPTIAYRISWHSRACPGVQVHGGASVQYRRNGLLVRSAVPVGTPPWRWDLVLPQHIRIVDKAQLYREMSALHGTTVQLFQLSYLLFHLSIRTLIMCDIVYPCIPI